MSRGPGRWQRAILAALDWQPMATLVDVGREEAGYDDLTRADLAGLHRAARQLEESGRIVRAECWVEDDEGQRLRRTRVARLDFAVLLRGMAVDATEDERGAAFREALAGLSATPAAGVSGAALTGPGRDGDG